MEASVNGPYVLFSGFMTTHYRKEKTISEEKHLQ